MSLESQPRIAGAVLAAGLGSRMGGPKALVEVGGRRLVDRAIAVLRDAGCEPVLAVVGSDVATPEALRVINPAPERGQRSSLELAVAAAGTPAALAVLLVDTPGIGPDAVARVVQQWRPGRIAVARYGGTRGHPIVMAPDLWRTALDAAGPDTGAREFLRSVPDLVDVVDVSGDPTDLDTPTELRAWAGTRDHTWVITTVEDASDERDAQ